MKAEAFLNSKVGGYVALGVLGVAVLWYVKRQAGAALTAVNPLNNDNVFNKGATATTDAVFGKGALATTTDYIFAAIDKLNPFNESDAYANTIFGAEALDKNIGQRVPGNAWTLPSFTMPEFSVDYLNPASDKNLINQGAIKVVGQENLSTAADYIFGLFDLINPFNESDAYARKVYNVDEDQRVINNNNSEGIN